MLWKPPFNFHGYKSKEGFLTGALVFLSVDSETKKRELLIITSKYFTLNNMVESSLLPHPILRPSYPWRLRKIGWETDRTLSPQESILTSILSFSGPQFSMCRHSVFQPQNTRLPCSSHTSRRFSFPPKPLLICELLTQKYSLTPSLTYFSISQLL